MVNYFSWEIIIKAANCFLLKEKKIPQISRTLIKKKKNVAKQNFGAEKSLIGMRETFNEDIFSLEGG